MKTPMSKGAHIEESLLKFFYGECTMDELKEIHRELCDSEECHAYLDSIAELLHLLKKAEDTSKVDQVRWEDLKNKFDKVIAIIENGKE